MTDEHGSNSTLVPPCTCYGRYALEDFSVFGLSYMLPQCLGNGKVREAKKPMKSKTRYLRYFAFLKGLVVSSSRLL